MAFPWFELLIFPGFVFVIILTLLSEQINSRLYNRLSYNTDTSPIFIPIVEHFKLVFKGEKEKVSLRSIVQIIMLILMVALPLLGSLVLPINLYETLPSIAGRYGDFKGTETGIVGVLTFEGDILLLLGLIALFGVLTFLVQYLERNNTTQDSVKSVAKFMLLDIPIIAALAGPILTKKSLCLALIAEDIRRIVQFNLVFGFVLLLPLATSISIFSFSLKFNQPYFDKVKSQKDPILNPPTKMNGKYQLWNLSMRLMEFLIGGIIVSICLGGAYLPIPFMSEYHLLSTTGNFIFKTILVLMLGTIIRAAIPRLKTNQTFNISIKVLTSLGLFSVLLIGGYIGLVGIN